MRDLALYRRRQGGDAPIDFGHRQAAIEAEGDLNEDALTGASRTDAVEAVVIIEMLGERAIDGELNLLLDSPIDEVGKSGAQHPYRVDDDKADDKKRSDGVCPNGHDIVGRDSGHRHRQLNEQRGD